MFPTKSDMPPSLSYLSDMGIMTELNWFYLTWHQYIIYIIYWVTKIGRVDIFLEVSLLSKYQESPCEEHLEQLLSILLISKRIPMSTI